MKTPKLRIDLWSLCLAVLVLAAGCGAPTAASDKEQPEASAPATQVPVVAATNAGTNAAPPPATPAVAAAPDPTNDPPPTQKSARAGIELPVEVNKVVELVEGGAGDEIVRAYVDGSDAAYELSLEQILYLRDIGISDGVIASMMRRGSTLREKRAEDSALKDNLVQAAEQIRQNLGTNGAPSTAASAAPAGTGAENPPAPPAPTADAAGQPGAPAVAGAPAAPPAPAVAAPVPATLPPPADAPVVVQQFYSPLAPYGTWYYTSSYGWIWQPTVVTVNAGWVPYQHSGRWVWTDWGWYWQSDYSWGWAPFHYGRWCTYPGIGWCWVPDSVWGPSWVTWRHYDTYIGWAPLPPHCGWRSGVGLTWYGSHVAVGFSFGLASHCYTFVPRHSFCHREIGRHAVRGDHHRAAYQNSVVVNNIINGNNNTIVNNGIGYDNVAKYVRDEVPKARIESLPNASNQALRADRMERSKNGAVIYRPTSVEADGGRPARIVPEVRPVSTAASGAPARPANLRSPGGVPSRVGASPSSSSSSSGLVSTPDSAKPVDSRPRSVNARPQSSDANAVTSRPGGADRPTATAPTTPSRPTARTAPSSSSGAKPVDGRSGVVPTAPGGGGGSSSPSLTPQRATTPVPLGDPSRNIPTRPSAQPNTQPNSRSTTAPTAKPSAVERSAPSYSSPTTSPGSSAPARSSSGGVQRAPSAPERPGGMSSPNAGPSAPSRSFNAAPTPSYSAPTAPSRPSYSAPAPSSAPTRPAYTAPAPSYSAPTAPSRPSYSAPAPTAAPAMSAPRPSYSAPAAPAPAPSAPSRGATPDGSTRSSGGRGGSRQVD